MTNTMLKKIAADTFEKEYGARPKLADIILLEADGAGYYILFRLGKYEYRVQFRYSTVSYKIENVTLENEADETLRYWVDRFYELKNRLDAVTEKVEAMETETR